MSSSLQNENCAVCKVVLVRPTCARDYGIIWYTGVLIGHDSGNRGVGHSPEISLNII